METYLLINSKKTHVMEMPYIESIPPKFDKNDIVTSLRAFLILLKKIFQGKKKNDTIAHSNT